MANTPTFADYVAPLPKAQREALEKLRTQILAAAPGAEEHLGYGLPGFKLNGHPFIYIGAAKNHCAIYGRNDDQRLAAKLKDYKQSKGTIQFTPDKPIPAAVVKEIVKARGAANEEKWGRKASKRPSPRTGRFKLVESLGRTLQDVEVTTAWGQPALKVRRKMFVCMASHRSAEPDTLVVMMDFGGRDALVEEDPDTYYLKEHYVGYPCVLVRLSRVRPDALRDLVVGAHRYVSAKSKSAGRSRRRSRT